MYVFKRLCTRWLTVMVLGTLLVQARPAKAQSASDIINTMVQTCRQLRTLSYVQEKWERVNGEMYYEKMYVKLQRNPFKVYIKQYHPREGLEILYAPGWNDGEAKVNAGQWVPNLNLDINGSRMRENQHHNVATSGFDHLVDIFEHLKQKYGTGDGKMQYAGVEVVNGRPCYVIKMNNPNFQMERYIVQNGENLISIAQKLHLSEYMILINNPEVDHYWDVSSGQAIRIPSDYGKRAEIYIDKITNVPMKVLVYDDRGLFEKYVYDRMKINPSFSSQTFSPENDAYGF